MPYSGISVITRKMIRTSGPEDFFVERNFAFGLFDFKQDASNWLE
jgi:hypothetical protein